MSYPGITAIRDNSGASGVLIPLTEEEYLSGAPRRKQIKRYPSDRKRKKYAVFYKGEFYKDLDAKEIVKEKILTSVSNVSKYCTRGSITKAGYTIREQGDN